MGYTTTFTGSVSVTPPLNEHEITYLLRFAEARHMDRELGPYYWGAEETGVNPGPDVRDRNHPPAGQPSLFCHFAPSADGSSIAWNGAGNFSYAERWMAYLIRTFLAPGAALAAELSAPRDGRYYAPEFAHFTFDHVVDGTIDAEGEESGDTWRLVVHRGEVSVVPEGDEPRPVTDTAADPPPVRYPARLRGGPHDGETWSVRSATLATGLLLPDRSRYRLERTATGAGRTDEDGAYLLTHVNT